MSGDPAPTEPTPEERLWAALADAGAAIEAMPFDRRFAAVDRFLGEGLPAPLLRRFLIGVIVAAHERRIATEMQAANDRDAEIARANAVLAAQVERNR